MVDLLELARADEGALAKGRKPVDLDELVRDEVSRQRLTSRVPIDAGALAAVQLPATGDELRSALANLIGNAVRHARTRVAVSLAAGTSGATLVVADDGPGVPVGQRDRVFGRFVRLDDARSRDNGGSGLGLAITKEIIEAHVGPSSSATLGPERASKCASRFRALRARIRWRRRSGAVVPP